VGSCVIAPAWHGAAHGRLRRLPGPLPLWSYVAAFRSGVQLHCCAMARFFNLPRSRQVLAAIAAAGQVTGGFRLGGLLGTAAQVTAYATAVLALGVIGLAAGAGGMYAELRVASQQQAGQLARQRLADLAQIKIERFSGPGEMLRIEVHNGSERAITNVYVWADARGVRGHYAAGVPVDDAQVRRMANVPHDGDLFWRLRVIRPGQHAFSPSSRT